MRMLAIAVLLGGFFVSACQTIQTPSPEAEASQCRPNLDWGYWKSRLGVGDDVSPLSAEQRIMFLRGFNAEPPVSDYNPSTIFLIAVDRVTVVAFFVEGPCVTLMNPIPLPVVAQWMKAEGV